MTIPIHFLGARGRPTSFPLRRAPFYPLLDSSLYHATLFQSLGFLWRTQGQWVGEIAKVMNFPYHKIKENWRSSAGTDWICFFLPHRPSFVVPWIRTKWFQRTEPGKVENGISLRINILIPRRSRGIRIRLHHMNHTQPEAGVWLCLGSGNRKELSGPGGEMKPRTKMEA